jgi:hypothetical protein
MYISVVETCLIQHIYTCIYKILHGASNHTWFLMSSSVSIEYWSRCPWLCSSCFKTSLVKGAAAGRSSGALESCALIVEAPLIRMTSFRLLSAFHCKPGSAGVRNLATLRCGIEAPKQQDLNLSMHRYCFQFPILTVRYSQVTKAFNYSPSARNLPPLERIKASH